MRNRCGEVKHSQMVNGRLLFCWLAAAATVFLAAAPSQAVPSFSRKYNTSCQTCHTAFPVLNSFGEAFRRDGYRFPSIQGSEDSDAATEQVLPLGSKEQDQPFPASIWPTQLAEKPPLSLVVFGNVDYVLPNTDLYRTNKSHLLWDTVIQNVSLIAAGSFSNRVTYYAKAAFTTSSAKISAAQIICNDLIGPRHLVNLSVGRLLAPQLTSYAWSESYVTYQFFPAVSVAGLFNSNATAVVGQGPVDGAEVHGVAYHRIGYSLGAVASRHSTGLSAPNSEDFYLHVGAKFGGVSLDGEGQHGLNDVDAARPWSETSLTFDTFGYRGILMTDNGINAPALTAQRSAFTAVGHVLHLNLGSLSANVMGQYQRHYRPYPGTAPATPPDGSATLPGVPDNHKGRGLIGSSEIAYVVYPWFIPAVRGEYTRLDSDWGIGSLLRVMPGATFLIRPNMRLYIAADIQRAHGLPPVAPGGYSWWTLASGNVQPSDAHADKLEVERISAVFTWAL